ncbi:HpcH/HpaI aldolase/citrate lyase family protein [Candidimonas nitroreducens]|uniref:CoA ester lyase n=1 Tax=Candidimonas nitroreducens TaxID=683354 RepID=A0A225MS81_9BURK|nr:CoA ester lyase [Candidimonas nitroreducens]OWT63912.1 CoA ester lyase [Candidimonas nitroreducens]
MRLHDEKDLPVWRSLLFVPANIQRFIDKAQTVAADGIILDLEDSVPSTLKDSVRQQLPAAVDAVGASGADVLVRVNQPLELCVPDFETAISPKVKALILPKVESASHVRLLAELADRIEARHGMKKGHTRFMLLIESPEALEDIVSIASAHPRNIAISAGGEDFATATGSLPVGETMIYPRQRSVIAASIAGILPMGLLNSVAEFNDDAAYRDLVRRSRNFGLRGATCIHPRSVPLLNEGFRPAEHELAAAQRVVQGFVNATTAGRASVQVDGRMVDYPIYDRAIQLLRTAERIKEKESRQAAV